MPQGPARKFVRERFTSAGCRFNVVTKIQVRCSRVVFRALRFSVQLNHARFVQRTFEFAKRGVAERMLDSNHALRSQPITRRERLPAILASEEFMGDSDFQFGMLLQIGDSAKTEALRFAAAHNK